VRAEPFELTVGGFQLSVADVVPTSVTAMANAGSAALVVPSLTLMTIFESVPTLAAAGVPESSPVVALKLAHVGLSVMEKLAFFPASTVAFGSNAYAWPATTDFAGDPAMVGFVYGADTSMENAASAAFAVPVLTLMVMSAYAPSCALVGVPLSSPVAMLKLAQEGLCAIEKLSVLPAGPLAVGVNAYACPAITDVAGLPVIVGAVGAAAT
jgi:hypothetical protein